MSTHWLLVTTTLVILLFIFVGLAVYLYVHFRKTSPSIHNDSDSESSVYPGLSVHIQAKSPPREKINTMIVRLQRNDTKRVLGGAMMTLVDGTKINYVLFYSYEIDRTHKGQVSAGFDQFTVYYSVKRKGDPNPVLVESFDVYGLDSIAYWSINYQLDDKSNRFFNCINENDQYGKYQYFFHGHPVPNPWTPSAKTTPCYHETTKEAFANPMTENTSQGLDIGVFRPDRQTSQQWGQEGGEPNECSVSYLISFLPQNEQKQNIVPFGYIKIKLPSYYETQICSQLSSDTLDVYYFSITAGQNKDSFLYPFWTVNFHMMKPMATTDGFAYVFWGPREHVMSQRTPDTPKDLPPIVRIQNIQGYMLGYPEFAFLFRYRGPDADWKGYVGKAPCYDTPAQEQPIRDVLGDFGPKVVGFTDLTTMINDPEFSPN